MLIIAAAPRILGLSSEAIGKRLFVHLREWRLEVIELCLLSYFSSQQINFELVALLTTQLVLLNLAHC